MQVMFVSYLNTYTVWLIDSTIIIMNWTLQLLGHKHYRHLQQHGRTVKTELCDTMPNWVKAIQTRLVKEEEEYISSQTLVAIAKLTHLTKTRIRFRDIQKCTLVSLSAKELMEEKGKGKYTYNPDSAYHVQ